MFAVVFNEHFFQALAASGTFLLVALVGLVVGTIVGYKVLDRLLNVDFVHELKNGNLAVAMVISSFLISFIGGLALVIFGVTN